MTVPSHFSQHIGDDPEVAARLRELVSVLSSTPDQPILSRTVHSSGRRRSSAAARKGRQRRRDRKATAPLAPVPAPRSTHAVRDRAYEWQLAAVKLSGRRALASSLNLEEQDAKIHGSLDPRVLKNIRGRDLTKPERFVVASLVVAVTHESVLEGSGIANWPLVAWHPTIAGAGLNADSSHLRFRLEGVARHARNLWSDTHPTIRGRCDESQHPELPAGYSTGAGVTGGE